MPKPADEHASEQDLLNNAIPIPHDEVVDLDEIDELSPIDAGDLSTGDMDLSEMSSTKIKTFGVRKAHEDHWNRTPNVSGRGAIHVKTFVTKLRMDAVEHLDQQVNEWLDAHPEYEVKFVTTAVGTLFGKNKEDAMFMNVWV